VPYYTAVANGGFPEINMTETTPTARTNPRAWISLALGVLSPPTFGATGIFAFFLGLAALRQINRSDGAQKGARAAIGGMLLGIAGIVLFFLGLGFIGLDNMRQKHDNLTCMNNLRRIGMAVNLMDPEAPMLGHLNPQKETQFPSGTVPNDRLTPDERLSWMVLILPYMETEPDPLGNLVAKAQHPGTVLFDKIDRSKGWNEQDRDVVNARLSWFLCPDGVRPQAGEAGLTNYLGIGGVGVNAAELPKDHPDAGFFGYNRQLTRADITRGVSETMMIAEAQTARSPWVQGGPATIRGLDPENQPYLGTRRQFGGLHDLSGGGANVLFVDGHAVFVGEKIYPRIFESQARIHRDE
jgi:prepilin-type processing-associated H-X9-DG protein